MDPRDWLKLEIEDLDVPVAPAGECADVIIETLIQTYPGVEY